VKTPRPHLVRKYSFLSSSCPFVSIRGQSPRSLSRSAVHELTRMNTNEGRAIRAGSATESMSDRAPGPECGPYEDRIFHKHGSHFLSSSCPFVSIRGQCPPSLTGSVVHELTRMNTNEGRAIRAGCATESMSDRAPGPECGPYKDRISHKHGSHFLSSSCPFVSIRGQSPRSLSRSAFHELTRMNTNEGRAIRAGSAMETEHTPCAAHLHSSFAEDRISPNLAFPPLASSASWRSLARRMRPYRNALPHRA
jgi:ribosomal protein L34